MQEEVECRAVALDFATTKITISVFREALIKLMAEMKKSRDDPPVIAHGKLQEH